ncbi:hypothetical protein [Desulfurobacterium atlanticum]|uniref:Lipoprotein n=1 Tax=Desulfurobacterium atlanticum TaxID=240169 RepID=A0A238ZNS6_9BACT|nr:hypothetical protein [Desulfurobacterium atlanticum]SNR84323.1 hypothetical protein SAMN06265340_1108 [Desulfurobacterium atlanticum]
MKKRHLLFLCLLLLPSCKTVTEKPLVSTVKEYPWKTIKKPSDSLKGVANCFLKCSNGTSINGKAIIKLSDDKATIKVYASAGIYAGKITVSNKGIFASENIAPFATYIRNVDQIKSALTGYIYDRNFIILSPYLIEIPFGKIKELYFYKDGTFDKVVIENQQCQLTIKPIKVKEAKNE